MQNINKDFGRRPLVRCRNVEFQTFYGVKINLSLLSGGRSLKMETPILNHLKHIVGISAPMCLVSYWPTMPTSWFIGHALLRTFPESQDTLSSPHFLEELWRNKPWFSGSGSESESASLGQVRLHTRGTWLQFLVALGVLTHTAKGRTKIHTRTQRSVAYKQVGGKPNQTKWEKETHTPTHTHIVREKLKKTHTYETKEASRWEETYTYGSDNGQQHTMSMYKSTMWIYRG